MFESLSCLWAPLVGVVWCGVVWCGVAWRGVAWCGCAWQALTRTAEALGSLRGASQYRPVPMQASWCFLPTLRVIRTLWFGGESPTHPPNYPPARPPTRRHRSNPPRHLPARNHTCAVLRTPLFTRRSPPTPSLDYIRQLFTYVCVPLCTICHPSS